MTTTGDVPDGRLAMAVERVAKAAEMTYLSARNAGALVLITYDRPGFDEIEPWLRLFHALTNEVGKGVAVAIGVGCRCESPSGVPRSWREAVRALTVRRGSPGGSGVTMFDGLGLYRILAGENTEEIEMFVRDWLGSLLDYDAEHRTDLVKTLSEYYESGGRYDEAARRLLIHRSTLRYRLQRIREVTGRDITAVDPRLNLHVATRAWKVLQGSS